MTNQQRSRTLQQVRTTLARRSGARRGEGVLRAALGHLLGLSRSRPGPTYLTLRGLGGEEIAIGVAAGDGGTTVSASSYMFDQQVARFLSTLPPVAEVVA